MATKRRKHKFVTQCIEAGEVTLTVWPTAEEVSSESAKKKYDASVAKIANDPRVVDSRNSTKHQFGIVFTIDPDRG